MTAPAVPLTSIGGGISRLRVKGAALKNTLYDALNCYVTMQQTVVIRPGTIRQAQISQNTKGLVGFAGEFHVFSNDPTVMVPSGYALDVLINPVNGSLALEKIHFAAPFMGFLYVVPEFTDGSIYHYWLQSSGTWAADTIYYTGDYILPTVPNGFAYLATRLAPLNSTWSPNSPVTLNQIVEPNIYNGFMYQAIAVAGTTPHTGAVEPTWPITENATIQEFGDFNTTAGSNTTGIVTSTTLAPSITDRYGDSAVFSSNIGVTPVTAPTVTAQTKVSTWQPGTLYQPGAVVQPSTNQGAFINAIPNGDFEAGDDGNWVLPAGSNLFIIEDQTKAFQGSFCLECTPNRQTSRAVMNTYGAVTAGQSVTATGYINPNNSGANLTAFLNLNWYDSSNTFISRTQSEGQEGSGYRLVSVTGNAPAGATQCGVEIEFSTGTVPNFAYADAISWSLETPAQVSEFLYEAVQPAAGTSGSTEPAWPTVEGNEIVDGGVTWEAIGTSIITWQAIPIMKSGDTEPVWPTTPVSDGSILHPVQTAVSDGNMSWVLSTRQITDTKCPNTAVVAISSSKIFCGDDDIIAFSATTNPTDWSASNDAGFLPFGLQNYGSQPVAAMNIYRSNLVALNALGYQMWQTDEDPTNMAILDAQPVGCIYPKSAMPVNNDLVFLTSVGIRNIGTAGSQGNMQAGNTGKPIDPLVNPAVKALTGDQEPRGLFYPGTGQYQLWCGNQAFVLTINGNASQQSWTRYTLPYEVTDWTVQDGILYVRTTDPTAGDLVLQFDADTLQDDYQNSSTYVEFDSFMWWPYLDMGPIGMEKQLEGFDLAIDGTVTVSIGYNQKDFSQVTSGYTIDGDTLDQMGCIPFPVSAPSFQFRLDFGSGQAWEWELLNAYVNTENQT